MRIDSSIAQAYIESSCVDAVTVKIYAQIYLQAPAE